MSKITEPFTVKHYTGEERPSIKGNGFDGLEIGTERSEAEELVAAINGLLAQRNVLREALESALGRSHWLNDPRTGNTEAPWIAEAQRALEDTDDEEDPDRREDEINNLAVELDTEAWTSYTGKPKEFKQRMDARRTASLEKAAKKLRR